MHSSDLALWRALYDATLTRLPGGRFHVRLPFPPGLVELILDEVDGELGEGAVLEAVREEDGVLRLFTTSGVLQVPAEGPRLLHPDGKLVDRSTILAGLERLLIEEEEDRTVILAGSTYLDGNVNDAVDALRALAESGHIAALAVLGTIEALESMPGSEEHLDRAAEWGCEMADVVRRARDPGAIRMALIELLRSL